MIFALLAKLVAMPAETELGNEFQETKIHKSCIEICDKDETAQIDKEHDKSDQIIQITNMR